jgi:hypothetical protein
VPLFEPSPFPAGLPVLEAPVELRFEDVSQEGRLVLQAIPSALGGTLWNPQRTEDPVPAELTAKGMLPILSRFQIIGYDRPISALVAIEARWVHRLARTEEGRVAHDAWLDLYGIRGRTYGTVEGAGERHLAGRLYAEQILTRPFAPAGERRVTAADLGELGERLPRRAEHRPAAELLQLPAGSIALEAVRSADVTATVFGLAHTDSNQHVNSLVYFRLFEEAALRRLHQLGRGTKLLGREIEVAYRKPCFAGEAARMLQQAFELDGRVGVSAALFPEAAFASAETLAQARPLTYARMLFTT